MASSHDQLRAQAPPIERKIKSLLNADLKAICKSEGLLVSGVKSVLQNRVLERLNDAIESGDASMFTTLRQRINNFGTPLPPTYIPHIGSSHIANSTGEAYDSMSKRHRSRGSGHAGSVDPNFDPTSRLTFKHSPFYTVLEPLSAILELPNSVSGRHVVQTTFSLPTLTIERLRNDKSIRIMVYCAVDPAHSRSAVDITFPHTLEIRINAETFPGNTRGIKKKPGTTLPADITDLSRKLNSYVNTVSLTYLASDRVHNPSPSKYCAIVNLVKKHTVPELLEQIKGAPKISKETVINEMVNKAKDADIVTTSTVMSLKCPLSTMRMTVPCRSPQCSHIQCFDAESFLQIQEQAPQWTCPTCNKRCDFASLAMDLYVLDILQTVPKSVDQVTIEPNGKWKLDADKEEFRLPSTAAKRKVPTEFDDLVELSDYRSNGFQAPNTPPSGASRSREISRAASTNPRPSSAKKATEEVIDLTLDSEDDEYEPPNELVKRQSTSSFAETPSHLSFPPPPPSHLQSAPLRPLSGQSQSSTTPLQIRTGPYQTSISQSHTPTGQAQTPQGLSMGYSFALPPIHGRPSNSNGSSYHGYGSSWN